VLAGTHRVEHAAEFVRGAALPICVTVVGVATTQLVTMAGCALCEARVLGQHATIRRATGHLSFNRHVHVRGHFVALIRVLLTYLRRSAHTPAADYRKTGVTFQSESVANQANEQKSGKKPEPHLLKQK